MIRNAFTVARHSQLLLVAAVLGLPVLAQDRSGTQLQYQAISAMDATTNLLAKHHRQGGARASEFYQFGLKLADQDDDDKCKFRARLMTNAAFTSYGITGFGYPMVWGCLYYPNC